MGQATSPRGYWRFAGAWLFAAGLFLAITSPAFCAPAADLVTDVALQADGTLVGQVVSPSGAAVPGLSVSLRLAGKEVAATTTDRLGLFAFSGLRSGLYEVRTGRGIGYYRVWDARIAPPSARPSAMIVAVDGADGFLVRGQDAPCNWRHPLLIGTALGLGVGAGVTAAIYENNRHSASN